MATTDISNISAKQLVTKLKKGELKSRDLLERYIERVQRHNGKINAVVATDYERARERADQADKAAAAGESWGPLHGLPMTIKDTYEVVGMPTTSGSQRLAQHTPVENAFAVQRLLDAGAVIFGKTNVPFMGSDLQSYNKVYGTSHNPWNANCTPGGSSGGAAAAVAAGLTPVELGSDIAGSIRIPAHFCGVFGHKASHGTISLRGHIPGPPGTVSEPDMAVGGPLARNADDLQLLMDVVAHTPPDRQPGWQLKLPAAKTRSLKGAKIWAWFDDPLCIIDHRLRELYDDLLFQLKQAGAEVTLGTPMGKGLEYFYKPYLNLLGGIMGAARKKHERQAMHLLAPILEKLDDMFHLAPRFDNFLYGMGESHMDWLRYHEMRSRIREKFSRWMQPYDAVLMPVSLTTALYHQHKPELPLRRIDVNGEPRSYTENFMWISLATLMGLPATSAPIGLIDDRMPANVQVMGGPYADKQTIKVAGLITKLMNGLHFPEKYRD